jgi:hypothetical protein
VGQAQHYHKSRACCQELKKGSKGGAGSPITVPAGEPSNLYQPASGPLEIVKIPMAESGAVGSLDEGV